MCHFLWDPSKPRPLFFLKWASEVLSKKQGREGWTMVTLGGGASTVISKGKAFAVVLRVAVEKGAGAGREGAGCAAGPGRGVRFLGLR